MLRTIIGGFIGVAFIAVSFFAAKKLIANKSKPKPVVEKIIKTVFVEKVKNGTVPIHIPANGNISAVRRVELYTEVQGVFELTSKIFRTGQTFNKGELLLKIDSKEFYASLNAERSKLLDLITAAMPDLRLDYPDSYPQWEAYLKKLDIDRNVPPLPKPVSDKEKYFITGKDITTTYYNVKNLEQRYTKYFIRAPFKGVLTEALVTEGTLVRSGQKLGEFIDPSTYELEVAISKSYSDLLEKGKKVALHDLEGKNTWEGTVKRINGRVDINTQTVKVYIQVAGEELKEGMYLEADLDAKQENDAFEISRKLLVNNSQVFTVEKGALKLVDVKPVFFKENTVVVKGLPEGSTVLKKAVPGAYEGMLVEIYKEAKDSKTAK